MQVLLRCAFKTPGFIQTENSVQFQYREAVLQVLSCRTTMHKRITDLTKAKEAEIALTN